MFAELMLSDQYAVNPEGLTASFGWSGRDEVIQHDVQELNRVLFAAIDDSLAGTRGRTIIESLYSGKLVNQIKCLKCNTLREREEEFRDLCLPVENIPNLQQRQVTGA
jgi:ubiquitin carboxyl-terminal hydrolase 40